jgi:hypothetical protein
MKWYMYRRMEVRERQEGMRKEMLIGWTRDRKDVMEM